MDIVEGLIARPGQSQEGRLPAELGPHFAEVEERRARELYELVRKLAAIVRFRNVNAGGTALVDDGDWQPFFQSELPGTRDGATAPHLALLAAFLKLYRIPRCAMNGIAARHMDFLYRRVLGFVPQPARPDRAHVILELKKGAQALEIGPAHAFSAGKDKSGAELVYVPANRTVVSASKVERLCAIFVDATAPGRVHFAPKADSADGAGGKLEGPEPKWRPFGGPDMPLAQVGFAIASPVLRMKEGARTVKIDLAVAGARASQTPNDFLECFVTGETRWLGPYALEGSISEGAVSLAFTVPEAHEAVGDYDVAVHGHAFATAAPVVQVLLKRHDTVGYSDLAAVTLKTAAVSVEVSGVKSLQLESDLGTLDPRRAFQPFGPQPVVGSRLLAGYAEALGKRLDRLQIQLNWLGGPLGSQQAAVSFEDADGWKVSDERRSLSTLGEPWTFDRTGDAGGGGRLSPGGVRASAYANIGTNWAAAQLGRQAITDRNLNLALLPLLRRPKPRGGFINVTLLQDFGHALFRHKLLNKEAVTEPYTPVLRDLSLSYTAHAFADLQQDREDGFIGDELEFFHVDCFGERREHAFLRSRNPYAGGRPVPLVAPHGDAGELLIGVSGIEGGDSASLLFQVAEGSADPEALGQKVSWAVLCDNYWKPLEGADAVRDGTNGLLESGRVTIGVSGEATLQNTLLPAGLIWIKAAVPAAVNAVCSLIVVAANALEVTRQMPRAEPGSAWLPLAAKRITRLKTPVAAVKTVAQPFASFGGRAEETGMALRRRAAERLRHRNRCIAAWDYERMVLEAFPQVRKVKCIPHSKPGGPYLAPGHVLVVVVPDLRNRHAIDPLQPRADAATLRAIEDYLRPRAGMQIEVIVRNPRYRRIRLDFKVKFRERDFNYHARALREALLGYLSPWTRDPGHAIEFGGAIHKSVLLDFVEDLDYVDFVTDFRMHLRGAPQDAADVDEARAATPDAILVSDDSHDIAEASP